MRWLKLGLYFVGGLAVLLTLALVWLLSADLGVFKPRIEQLVTDATGRKFSIDGDLHISIGRHTLVTASDLRLGNADWAPDPLMLEVGQVELTLDTWSLVNGPVLVELLRVSDATAHLATSARDGDNWNLGVDADEEPQGLDAGKPGKGWLVRQVDVDNARIVYTSPSRPAPLDLHIAGLRQRHDADDFLRLRVDAVMAARDIAVDARLGPWRALLDQKNIDFRLAAQIDTLSLTGEGHIDDLLEPRRPTLAFTASGPDLNDVARLLNLEETYVGDVDLEGTLQSEGDNPLVLDVAGHLGQMQASATGSFSDLKRLEQADLELAISGPDLNRLLRLAGAPAVQPAPYLIELSAERRGPKLAVRKAHMEFADARFDLAATLPNFPTVDGADIQLTVSGQHFERFREVTGMPGAATGPYSLTANVSDAPDGAELVRLEARSSLLHLTADGRLGDAPDYVGSRFEFSLDTDSLATLGGAYRIDALPDRPLSVNGAVELTDAGVQTASPMRLDSGDLSARIEGLYSPRAGATGSDLLFSVRAPDFASIASDFVASDRLPSLPFSADGRLQVENRGYRLRKLAMRLGSTSIEVDGLVSPDRGFAGSALSIASRGPMLEELTAPATAAVYPGPFALATDVAVSTDAIDLANIEFSRPRGQISGGVRLMLPLSARNATFDLRGAGDDLHALAGAPFGFKPAPATFTLQARGELLDRRLSLDRLDIGLGRSTASASGQLDLGDAAGSARLTLAVNIPDLAELGTFRERRFNSQRFALDARAISEAGAIRIEDLVATLGDSNVRGAVALEQGGPPFLDVRIASDRLRYAPLLQPLDADVTAPPDLADGRLIPDVSMPFEHMARIDATVDIAIGTLQREALRLTDVTLAAALRDGALDIRHLGFYARGGWLQARGSLHPAGGTGKAALALTAKDLSIALPGFNENLAATADMDINLASTGRDLRSLAGNLEGIAFMRLDDLTVTENRFLERLYGDLLGEIISVINPFAKARAEQRLECVVAPLEFSDGMVRTTPGLLIRTDKVRIVSAASVNLKNERIDMQFDTTPRKGITISASELLNPYVRVTGTLAKPELAVDADGVLISGGAAVATGGLSILAKAAWGRLSRDADPCQTTERLALEAFSGRLAALEPATAD